MRKYRYLWSGVEKQIPDRQDPGGSRAGVLYPAAGQVFRPRSERPRDYWQVTSSVCPHVRNIGSGSYPCKQNYGYVIFYSFSSNICKCKFVGECQAFRVLEFSVLSKIALPLGPRRTCSMLMTVCTMYIVQCTYNLIWQLIDHVFVLQGSGGQGEQDQPGERLPGDRHRGGRIHGQSQVRALEHVLVLLHFVL